MPDRHLTLEERRTIFRLLNAKLLVEAIAKQLGHHCSTIFREISCNLFREVKEYRGYFPITTEDNAKRRQQRRRKLIQNTPLRQHVIEMLATWWSPEQIARRRWSAPVSRDDLPGRLQPRRPGAGAPPPSAPCPAPVALPLRPQAPQLEGPARTDDRPATCRDRAAAGDRALRRRPADLQTRQRQDQRDLTCRAQEPSAPPRPEQRPALAWRHRGNRRGPRTPAAGGAADHYVLSRLEVPGLRPLGQEIWDRRLLLRPAQSSAASWLRSLQESDRGSADPRWQKAVSRTPTAGCAATYPARRTSPSSLPPISARSRAA